MKEVTAIALAVLGAFLASCVGTFNFLLHGLDHRSKCPANYLIPKSRFLFYYLPLFLLPLGSTLLIERWGLRFAVVVLAVLAFCYGAFRARREATQSLAAHLVQTLGLDRPAALGEAKRIIKTTLDMKRGSGASAAVNNKLFDSGARERQKREKFEELNVGEEEFANSQKATWLVSRGNYYGDKGMLDEALEDFQEALQLKPDHLPAHISRVLVYATRGENDAALRLLKEMPEEMKLYGKVVATKQEILGSVEAKTRLHSLGIRIDRDS